MSSEKQNNMSFFEHLEIFRWHIVRSIIAILVFTVVAFIFHKIIFDQIILAPKSDLFFTNQFLCKIGQFLNSPSLCINSKPLDIININMAGQFNMHLKVAFFSGLILGFPYILFEIWRFIKPALYENERKYSRGGILISSLLFFMGVTFGYFIIVPLTIHFLGGYNISQEVSNQINLGSYISTVTSVSFAGGLTFQLPIIIYILSKTGVVSATFLKKYRRHAIVLILLLSAIITPPDIFSLTLVTLPLILLYEISILIAKRLERKKRKSEIMKA